MYLENKIIYGLIDTILRDINKNKTKLCSSNYQHDKCWSISIKGNVLFTVTRIKEEIIFEVEFNNQTDTGKLKCSYRETIDISKKLNIEDYKFLKLLQDINSTIDNEKINKIVNDLFKEIRDTSEIYLSDFYIDFDWGTLKYVSNYTNYTIKHIDGSTIEFIIKEDEDNNDYLLFSFYSFNGIMLDRFGYRLSPKEAKSKEQKLITLISKLKVISTIMNDETKLPFYHFLKSLEKLD